MGIQKESTWFQWSQPLGWGSGTAAKCPKGQDADAEVIEAIDAMERGLSCEPVTARFVQPQPSVGKRQMMVVKRSADHLQHTLFDDDMCAVLIARTVMERNFVEIFAAGGKNPSELSSAHAAVGPVFTLTFDNCKKLWQMGSQNCEHCGWRAPHLSCASLGGQTFLRVAQSKEDIGEARALCMDVEIPQVHADGSREFWCPLCAGNRAKRMELSSERPKWNDRIQALTMDFDGRAQLASAKNFKLCLGGQKVLLFGKRANGDFCLDFEHPLSMAQAFAIALTTMFWT